MEGNLQTFSPQSPSPTLPLPIQPSPDKKWIKQILLIVFIALLSSGATYLVLTSRQKQTTPQRNNQTQAQLFPSPIPDPTANWLTYTNKNLNFSIKYPVTWGILEENEEVRYPIDYPRLKEVFEIVFATPELIEFYKPPPQKTIPEKTVTPANFPFIGGPKATQVLIQVYENPNHLSLKEILNEVDSASSYTGQGISDQSVFINGIEGIRRTFKENWRNSFPDQEIVFVERGGKFYKFILNFVTDARDMETVNQILSSIKFPD